MLKIRLSEYKVYKGFVLFFAGYGFYHLMHDIYLVFFK